MDAEVWGDPESFRPERFLDANEQVILKDQLIAFSIGKFIQRRLARKS